VTTQSLQILLQISRTVDMLNTTNVNMPLLAADPDPMALKAAASIMADVETATTALNTALILKTATVNIAQMMNTINANMGILTGVV
jgi:hypothetical protein